MTIKGDRPSCCTWALLLPTGHFYGQHPCPMSHVGVPAQSHSNTWRRFHLYFIESRTIRDSRNETHSANCLPLFFARSLTTVHHSHTVLALLVFLSLTPSPFPIVTHRNDPVKIVL